MTSLNLGIDDKAPKSHGDSGFLAGLGCTGSELHMPVPVLGRAWGLGTCSQHLAQQGPPHPRRNPGQPHCRKPLGTGEGVQQHTTGEKHKPPRAQDREQQTARLVQAGCGNTSAVIRGLQNNLCEETRELVLLSLEEKAGNRARHDSAVAVHERLLLREAAITLLEGQR